MGDFPQGYFFIRSVASGKVLDVFGEGKEPGAKVIVWDRKSSGYDNQLWKHDSGFLINKNSGLALEVPGYEGGGKITAPTALVQAGRRKPPGSLNQLWAYNYQTLMPYDPKVCITAENGDFSRGSRAVVDNRIHGDVAQKWMFDIE